MAISKLHIICGNCGCHTMLKFHISPDAICKEVDGELEFSPAVYISCGNCSTLHNLDRFAPMSSTREYDSHIEKARKDGIKSAIEFVNTFAVPGIEYVVNGMRDTFNIRE